MQFAGEQRKLYAAHEQRLRMQLEHSEEADFNTSKIRILAELTWVAPDLLRSEAAVRRCQGSIGQACRHHRTGGNLS